MPPLLLLLALRTTLLRLLSLLTLLALLTTRRLTLLALLTARRLTLLTLLTLLSLLTALLRWLTLLALALALTALLLALRPALLLLLLTLASARGVVFRRRRGLRKDDRSLCRIVGLRQRNIARGMRRCEPGETGKNSARHQQTRKLCHLVSCECEVRRR